DHRLKSAARNLLNRGARSRQTQEALWRHHNQRSLESCAYLPAQQVEILGGGTRITDAQIIRGTELQKPLEPGTRMLGPLAFVTMRQQHRQARTLFPLVFAGR